MKVIYENKDIPVVTKRQNVDNQIIVSKKNNTVTYRILLSNDICHGSVKPLVSITNQLTKKIDFKISKIKDILKKDLSYERILITINT